MWSLCWEREGKQIRSKTITSLGFSITDQESLAGCEHSGDSRLKDKSDFPGY